MALVFTSLLCKLSSQVTVILTQPLYEEMTCKLLCDGVFSLISHCLFEGGKNQVGDVIFLLFKRLGGWRNSFMVGGQFNVGLSCHLSPLPNFLEFPS